MTCPLSLVPCPKRIVVIGPSNIGDAVLMSPVVAQAHRAAPEAQITLLVGERAAAVFERDPRLHALWVMESYHGALGKLRLARDLRALKPDALIDLRQTALPLCLRPWRAWRYFLPVPRRITHMRERHLWRLRQQAPELITVPGSKGTRTAQPVPSEPGTSLHITDEMRAIADRLLTRWGVDRARPLVIVCPGARSHIKRWPADRFAKVADALIERQHAEVILSGETSEQPIIDELTRAMTHRAHSAVGSVTIQQLAALMERTQLVITNDSASLHVASAVGAPTVAIFGPTDPAKYGPTSKHSRAIQRRLFCVPCEAAQCRYTHECLRFISVEDVLSAAHSILSVR